MPQTNVRVFTHNHSHKNLCHHWMYTANSGCQMTIKPWRISTGLRHPISHNFWAHAIAAGAATITQKC